uniref:Uncharacterized protein n=1 Tax=Ixodes ricinus TaxID=34613 RepID=A0A6B0TZI3_IXORI
MCFTASLVTRKVPLRLVLMTLSNVLSVRLTTGVISCRMPALFTTMLMVILLYCSSMHLMRNSTDVEFRTSTYIAL